MPWWFVALELAGVVVFLVGIRQTLVVHGPLPVGRTVEAVEMEFVTDSTDDETKEES